MRRCRAGRPAGKSRLACWPLIGRFRERCATPFTSLAGRQLDQPNGVQTSGSLLAVGINSVVVLFNSIKFGAPTLSSLPDSILRLN